MNDHIKSEISSYLAGVLPESRNRQIEAHAASCEKCRNALSKARAKQARIKREALKKAEPEHFPNLFLARQGKDVGVEAPSFRILWMSAGVLVLAVTGFWVTRRHHALVPLPPPSETTTPTAPAPVAAPAPPPKVSEPEIPKPPLVLHVFQDWKGPDCGIKEARLVVIRRTEAWQKLWTEMQLQDPLPEVDFEHRIVVGIFAGEKPIGTLITLGRIEEMDNVMYAPYRITPPVVQTSSGTATAVTVASGHPYLLALVPKVDMKIRLTEKENSQ